MSSREVTEARTAETRTQTSRATGSELAHVARNMGNKTPSNGKAVLILTVALELVTLILRFGFHLESTRDTEVIGLFTFGLRVHHGYCGLALLIVAYGLSPSHARLSRLGYVWGWSLLLSDLIHHFLVLWPVTGSPQFDFFYN